MAENKHHLRVLRVEKSSGAIDLGTTDYGISIEGPISDEAGNIHVWTVAGKDVAEYSVKVKAGSNQVRILVFEDGTIEVSASRKNGKRSLKSYGSIYLWKRALEGDGEDSLALCGKTKAVGVDCWGGLSFPDRPGLVTIGIDLGMKCPAYVTIMENGELLVEKRINQGDLHFPGNPQFVNGLRKRLPVKNLDRLLIKGASQLSLKLSEYIVSLAKEQIGTGKDVVAIFEDFNVHERSLAYWKSSKKPLVRAIDRELAEKITNRMWSIFFHKTVEMAIVSLKKIGVSVYSVEAKRTSLVCSQCGSLGRRCHGKKFICDSCGYTANSDLNASLNLHKLYWSLCSNST